MSVWQLLTGLSILLTVIFALRKLYRLGYDKAITDIDSEAKTRIIDFEKKAAARREKVSKKHEDLAKILPNDWPDDGVIVLSKEGGFDPNVTTSSDLQLDRD